MSISRLAATALAALLMVGGPAALAAQDETAAPAAAPDPEEELDEAIKRFGYVAGLAQGCVADEQKPLLEKEVLEIHGSIARLLGVDRAFLFSTSFGYGTSVEVETEAECADVLKTYGERTKKYRDGRQGGT